MTLPICEGIEKRQHPSGATQIHMWKSNGNSSAGKIVPSPIQYDIDKDSDYIDLEKHPDFKMLFGDDE